MLTKSTNNKKIARNTFFLYARSFLLMIITLYTSRVVLQVLGETDFGIYNIVGSIIILFSFLNSALSAATQRFLNYEIGQGNNRELNRVFNMSIICHISLAILLLIIAETIGLWFVDNQINIPSERINATMWVFHLSVLGCVFNLLRIPFNALIVAFEDMSFYAYVSIFEAVIRLGIAFLLLFSSIDKLIAYSFLMALSIALVNVVYMLFCKLKYPHLRIHLFWDCILYKKLLSFTGWNLLGSVASVISYQGTNLVVNIVCGVALNAALGIAQQVQGAVNSFVNNFQIAFSPQIIKSYSSGEKDRMTDLIYRTSRISFCLMFILSIPIITYADQILNLWLVNVPKYTVELTQFMVIYCLVDTLSGPLTPAINATGKIRMYNVFLSAIIIFNIPLTMILLSIGTSPICVPIIRTIICVVYTFFRIHTLCKLNVISYPSYIKKTVIRCVALLAVIYPVMHAMSKYSDTLGMFASIFSITIICVLLVFLIGLDSKEKQFIISKVMNL